MSPLCALSAALTLSVSVAPARCQTAGFRPDDAYRGLFLRAAGMLVFPLGSDLEGLDPGPGVEADVRYTFDNRTSLGGGIRWSTHNFQGFTEDVSFLTLFGQIAYTFMLEGTPVRPVLGGRVGWANEMLPSVFDQTRQGLDVGAFGGAEFPVSETVSVDGRLLFDFLVLDQVAGAPTNNDTAQLFTIEVGVVVIP